MTHESDANQKVCKRCESREWRPTLFGKVGRKKWLFVTLAGLTMMILAVFTFWSSITIGAILFILGTVGVVSKQQRCMHCPRPAWKNVLGLVYGTMKLIILALFIGIISFIGFYPKVYVAPNFDCLFTPWATQALGSICIDAGFIDQGMALLSRVVKMPLEKGRKPDGEAYQMLFPFSFDGGDTGNEELVLQIKDKKDWVRSIAISHSATRSEYFVPYILKALEDKSALVKSAAARALRFRGRAKPTHEFLRLAHTSTPKLLDNLSDKYPVARASAAEALERLGFVSQPDKVEQALIEALKDECLDVRFNAVSGLMNSKSPEVARHLFNHIMKWKKRNCYEKYILSLNTIMTLRSMAKNGSYEALDYLKQLANDKEFNDVRQQISWSLQEIEGDDQEVDRRAAESIPQLLEALQDKDSHARITAMKTLAEMRATTATPYLIQSLNNYNLWPFEREEAAAALGQIGAHEAVPHLARIIKVNSPKLKPKGPRKKPRNIEKGVVSFKGVVDAGLLEACIQSLAKIGSPEAIQVLSELIKGEYFSLRKEAIVASGSSGKQDAVASLILSMRFELIRTAIKALGSSGKQDAVTPLIDALRDEDDRIRNAAAKSLGELASEDAIFPLISAMEDKAEMIRLSAITSLGKIRSKDAQPPLIKAINDSNLGVSLAAVTALGKIGDRHVAPSLIELATQPKTDPRLKREAFKVLSENLFEHLPLSLVESHALELIPAVYGAHEYSRKLMILISKISESFMTENEYLALLGPIHKRNIQKDRYTNQILMEDIHHFETAYNSPHVKSPILCYTISYLLKEKGYDSEALEWSERALRAIPEGKKIPLQVALQWIIVEIHQRQGQFERSLKTLEYTDENLIPKITVLEAQLTNIPFDTYTKTLKGISLSSLDHSKEAVSCLNSAEDLITKDENLTEDTKNRMIRIILAYRAKAHGQAAKDDSEKALNLSKVLVSRTILDDHAEEVALQVRIQSAVGEGDYETAHILMERLALKKSSRISYRGIVLIDSEKKQAYEKLKNIQASVDDLSQELELLQKKIQIEEKSKKPKEMLPILKQSDEAKSKSENQSKEANDLSELIRQRRAKQRELKEFFISLKRTNPEIATLVGAEPIEIRLLQQTISKSQAILQFLVLADRTFIFLVSQDDIQIYESSLGEDEIRKIVAQFRDAIFEEAGQYVAGPAHRSELGEDLANAILAPVKSNLNDYNHIIIIPNADLHLIPFEALTFNDHFLVESHAISYLSASSLLPVVTRTVSEDRKLIAIANPQNPLLTNLEGAEQEVEKIGTFFTDKQVYMRANAKKALLVGQDLRNHYLHLAMHGQAGRYEDTRLFFSDGFLTVPEIWGLYLDGSPLVVLSACETSLGERIGGDEVVSLANGFIFAGAGCVVSSLWNVADAQTAELMRLFYASMADGRSHAEALALAKREMIRRNGSAPYFWSGFVISGL